MYPEEAQTELRPPRLYDEDIDEETTDAELLFVFDRVAAPMCTNNCGRPAAEGGRFTTCCRTCRPGSAGPGAHGRLCEALNGAPGSQVRQDAGVPLCANGCGRTAAEGGLYRGPLLTSPRGR